VPTPVSTLRICAVTAIVAIAAAGGSLAGGCARPAAPPVATAMDVPLPAPAQAVPAESEPHAAVTTPVEATVKVRFRVLDQELRRDPKTGREAFHTTLELLAATEPPQRLAIGTLNEPGCRLASEPAELDEAPNVRGGLVCYYAGYGDYVKLADDGAGRVVVSTYGQSEALIGNEDPPHEHERVVGKLMIPPGSHLVFELVEADAGILP